MQRCVNGTSGATVVIHDDAAMKTAPSGPVLDRVIAQGRMMRSIGPSAFPRVYHIGPRGYVMEKLSPIDWTSTLLTGGRIFTLMKSVLQLHLWRRSARVPASWVLGDEHIKYVEERSRDMPEVARNLLKIQVALSSRKVTVVENTHGDPTVENVMARSTGDIVFIDPLPYDARVPNLLAVDLGKMLQSAHGYESVKDPNFPLKPGHADVVLSGAYPDDALAAKYFHIVHLIRLIPYQKPEHVGEFIKQAHEFSKIYAQDV